MKELFLAGILILTGGACFGNDLFVPGTVTGDNVSIRVGPSLRAEIVGQVGKGQTVNVIASDGEWCAITPPPGLIAWVSAAYLQDGIIIGNRVNVRSGPGISYARLIQLNKGDRPEVRKREGDWVDISMPVDVKLWINARYVALSEGADSIFRSSVPFPSQTQGEGDTISQPAPEREVTLFIPSPTILRPSGTPFLPRSAPSYTPS
ncbi:unnamed protein product, partial [marine sediment metagenome]